MQSADDSVRSTDQDALISRHSAASLGYLSDNYAQHFLSPSARRSSERRPPLINIGTHARTWAVDTLVYQFLCSANDKGKAREDMGKRQVLSIGAGTDTRFWRFRERFEKEGRSWSCRKWVEVDFQQATASKARAISMKADLRKALGGDLKVERGGTVLSSPLYAVLPADLRDLNSLTSLLTGDNPFLDSTIPTLLLAECVLVYIPPETNHTILEWFAKSFANAACVSYDPFGLDDNFGKVMLRNLAARNLTLPSVSATPTLSSLSERTLKASFSTAHSLSIRQIRSDIIPQDEIARITNIERIDEVEELNLLLDHYAVTWSTKGCVEVGLQDRARS